MVIIFLTFLMTAVELNKVDNEDIPEIFKNLTLVNRVFYLAPCLFLLFWVSKTCFLFPSMKSKQMSESFKILLIYSVILFLFFMVSESFKKTLIYFLTPSNNFFLSDENDNAREKVVLILIPAIMFWMQVEYEKMLFKGRKNLGDIFSFALLTSSNFLKRARLSFAVSCFALLLLHFCPFRVEEFIEGLETLHGVRSFLALHFWAISFSCLFISFFGLLAFDLYLITKKNELGYFWLFVAILPAIIFFLGPIYYLISMGKVFLSLVVSISLLFALKIYYQYGTLYVFLILYFICSKLIFQALFLHGDRLSASLAFIFIFLPFIGYFFKDDREAYKICEDY